MYTKFCCSALENIFQCKHNVYVAYNSQNSSRLAQSHLLYISENSPPPVDWEGGEYLTLVFTQNSSTFMSFDVQHVIFISSFSPLAKITWHMTNVGISCNLVYNQRILQSFSTHTQTNTHTRKCCQQKRYGFPVAITLTHDGFLRC